MHPTCKHRLCPSRPTVALQCHWHIKAIFSCWKPVCSEGHSIIMQKLAGQNSYHRPARCWPHTDWPFITKILLSPHEKAAHKWLSVSGQALCCDIACEQNALPLQVPILFALSEAQLFELARCMGTATFTAGQLVFAKGDPGVPRQSNRSLGHAHPDHWACEASACPARKTQHPGSQWVTCERQVPYCKLWCIGHAV